MLNIFRNVLFYWLNEMMRVTSLATNFTTLSVQMIYVNNNIMVRYFQLKFHGQMLAYFTQKIP